MSHGYRHKHEYARTGKNHYVTLRRPYPVLIATKYLLQNMMRIRSLSVQTPSFIMPTFIIKDIEGNVIYNQKKIINPTETTLNIPEEYQNDKFTIDIYYEGKYICGYF